ncbi:pitrilysin family protein [Aquincola sp. MAHUQ-54]|uniref:Pitrilysin family protein n=1 Tax=Aquincola agrisoli TaxID=3119538 RepID=A0AAW9QER4_9BURK
MTDAATSIHTLANGVRVVALRLPHLASASVSVFVRTGSLHETRRNNGISHVVEHMAFKGTHGRDCQQINLDAERLGAEVNAHTDKDHTAYHMRGLAKDAGRFVHMLADIVRNGTYPDAELERERQVILQELAEDEDDPVSTAYKLFDHHCFGSHAMALPVIGARRVIETLKRDELLAYVGRQYTGANVVVGAAGSMDVDELVATAEQAFGSMPAGHPNAVPPAPHIGGASARRQTGASQTHVVLGFPIPALAEPHHASLMAAAVFGEGMSSPLMDEIRERRGLAYYASCSADVYEPCGQFIVEASMAPEHVDEFFGAVSQLLAAQAERIDPVALQRARSQLIVREVLDQERPQRQLERAVLDLMALGRVRTPAERAAALDAVGADEVRQAFAQLLARPPALALAGRVRPGALDRAREALAAQRIGG